MHLNRGLQFCLLLLALCLLASGKPTGKSKKNKKARGGKTGVKDELHQFKYKCNKKGACRYQFTLSLPQKEAAPLVIRNATMNEPPRTVATLDEDAIMNSSFLKNFIRRIVKSETLVLEANLEMYMQEVIVAQKEHEQEIRNLKEEIAVLRNQTLQQMARRSELDDLYQKFAVWKLNAVSDKAMADEQIELLKMQLGELRNETLHAKTLHAPGADHSEEIQNLKNELADMKKLMAQLNASRATEGLGDRVADLQKQIKRGQKKQRKLTEQVEVLRNKTAHSGNELASTVQVPSSINEYSDEYRKNFTSLSTRVGNVERLFYGYASADKYIYVMRVSEPRKNMPTAVGQDCAVLRRRNLRKNGVFEIRPDPDDETLKFFTYCDMYTNGGGWTMVQRRQGGVENFNRDWQEYRDGFGDPEGEFWLGLEKMYKLNIFGNNELRFDLWDFHGKHKYAVYKNFRLANETEKYRIEVGLHEGTAGDAFHYGNLFLQQNRQQFTTRDSDNDKVSHQNCAVEQKGGWWYQKCGVANLNGNFYDGGVHLSNKKDGILWQPWHQEESLRRTEVKIRPMDF